MKSPLPKRKKAFSRCSGRTPFEAVAGVREDEVLPLRSELVTFLVR